MLPIDNSNRQPPPPPPPPLIIQSSHPGAVAYRLYDGSLQNSMLHQSLAPNTPHHLNQQSRKRSNREDSPKSNDPSPELELQDPRNAAGGAATKKPRKDYEWIYITGDACHSIRQVNAGLDLTHTKKKYRNMKCLYCAEYNASTPWATLKPRKYETENLIDHENSSHHRKAVAARNIALGISTGNPSTSTGMDENGMMDPKGLKAGLFKGGLNSLLDLGGNGALLHHAGNPNGIMHLNPNTYLLQQAQLQQQPHLQQDMRMFEFPHQWAMHQSNMMSQHQQQTQGASGLQHPYGLTPEHLSWSLEGGYHQPGNMTLPPPPTHHLLPHNRAMNQLSHSQQLPHLHSEYPMHHLLSMVTNNASSSNGNQPQNHNGNRLPLFDYSPAAAMYSPTPSKPTHQGGGNNANNNNNSNNNGHNNTNSSNNSNLNNGNGNQQQQQHHTGNANNNLIGNDQMIYLNYGNGANIPNSQGYQLNQLPLQSNVHHTYPAMASMNLGAFSAPFLTTHAAAAAVAAGQFNQMNHANNTNSNNTMLSNYSSSNPPVEQSASATATASGEHFQRPKGRYSPIWLHVQGKFCYSDRQVITGKDLSKTKKKYRLVLCTYCAEFLPNTPWASLKPRKFETAVFIEHERSLNHKKAEELKKHKEQQEKGGDQPLTLTSDEQGGRYSNEQEEEEGRNEDDNENNHHENNNEEEEDEDGEGNDDGSTGKRVNILMSLYGRDSDSEKEGEEDDDEEEEQGEEEAEEDQRMTRNNIPFNTPHVTDRRLSYSDEDQRYVMTQPLPSHPPIHPDNTPLPQQSHLHHYGRREERGSDGRTNSFSSNNFEQDVRSYNNNNDVIGAAPFIHSSSTNTEESTLGESQPLVIQL